MAELRAASPSVVAILASAAACDMVAAPSGAILCRVAPREVLLVGGEMVGRVTSAERSPALGRAIGLGWVRASGGGFPSVLDVAGHAGARARVVPTPFYDPGGERIRG